MKYGLSDKQTERQVEPSEEELVNQYGECGEHPRFTRRDWREEVWESNTNLGYWAWVESELEIESF